MNHFQQPVTCANTAPKGNVFPQTTFDNNTTMNNILKYDTSAGNVRGIHTRISPVTKVISPENRNITELAPGNYLKLVQLILLR